jgi:hypothetical protein
MKENPVGWMCPLALICGKLNLQIHCVLVMMKGGAFGRWSGLDEIKRVGPHEDIGVCLREKREIKAETLAPSPHVVASAMWPSVGAEQIPAPCPWIVQPPELWAK